MTRTLFASALLASALLTGFNGCQSTASPIPPSAQPVSMGSGSLTYRAGDTGTVYVWDKSTRHMVYQGAIGRDQVLTIDAPTNRVLIDGRPVVENVALGSGNRYEVYLDRHNVPGTTTVRREVITERRVQE